MSYKANLAVIIIIVLVILGGAIYMLVQNKQIKVTDFESCMKAGNPIMESYPRQCSANGRTFTESIEDDEDPTENKTFCNPDERNVDTCVKIYKPVCGWFDPEHIQCIRYPCANTYSNSCLACSDEKVLYWTEGECPSL